MKDAYPSSNQDLLVDIEHLMETHRDARPMVALESGEFVLEETLVVEMTALLQQAAGLLDRLAERFPANAPRASDDDHSERISGLAFVVRAQIVEAQNDLSRAGQGKDTWRLATVVDSSWHHMLNGLRAIETTLRAAENLPAKERSPIYLEESLEVRRIYSRFRRAILVGGEPALAEAEPRLRAAATTIAELRELPLYPFLRIGDRLELRNLRQRIVGWLDGEKDPATGRQIWQDLASFVRLLLQINLREELVEHDRRVIAEIHDMLPDEPGASAQVPATVQGKLDSLLGRDEELDELLLGAEPCKLEALASSLARLRTQLLSRRQHVALEILQD